MRLILRFAVCVSLGSCLWWGGAEGTPKVFAQSQSQAQAPTAEDEAAGIELFERHVRPLLHEHCYECHSQQQDVQEGELALDSRQAALSGGTRGPAVVPGKPEASLLIEAVRYENVDLQMPPSGRLPPAAVEVLSEWIRRGAPAPEGEAAGAAKSPGTIDWQKAREFWSFRPLAKAAPTEMAHHPWVRQPIDALVLDRLHAAGLEPRGEADRQTLIRRVTYDLLGLPPTPEEVDEFVNDSRPDAYERLIDRLLARPQYGERWARFWLDLVRYTDVTPEWLASAEHAWRYRDWVIRALNEDLPFDVFGRRQIAADALPDTTPDDLAALGMLGLSPTHWKELRLAPALIEQVVAEEWDEQIDALSRTFLGLTVSCARCHDHKFDPISTEDYYALAGVYASSKMEDIPLLETSQRAKVRQARQEVAELTEQLKKITEKEKDSPEAEQLEARIQQIRQQTPGFDAPLVHAVVNAAVYVEPDGEEMTKVVYRDGQARDLPIFQRGNPANPGPIVPRRFLRLFSDDPPTPFQHGSGRRELAEALFRDSGHLAARVFVNRIWKQHFGQGLVRTPSDFGSQGDRPTHPELLDDLAARFVAHGWSLKWLHRDLLLSATYRQSSEFDQQSFDIDPENRLLWRMNRQRLDVECWRDAMLAASQQLDMTLYGPSTELSSTTHRRRTLYGLVGRHEMNPMLRLFDVPEPSAHSPARQLTTTPLQQLFVLNGPLLLHQSEAIATRVLGEKQLTDDTQRVEQLYRWLLSRSANAAEQQAAQQFLATAQATHDDTHAAWATYVHALLGLNEMMFVD